MSKGEVYIEQAVLTTGWLKYLGTLIGWGVPPVHTRTYWGLTDSAGVKRYYMTELTADPITAVGEIVGEGDGFTIQITPVFFPVGNLIIGADAVSVEKLARSYGSIDNGDMNSYSDDREWFPDPQGYGAPMYGSCTSNTYTAWIMKHITSVMPPKPAGAVGWETKPMFPGPKKF